ncbi:MULTISPECIES: MFS transporter [unclassified Gemella]|uniref:MFS transporter n=1 Tax=unclassified Gemella TaxID=2624949 RepID=UPI001C0407C7|nr:MULTISPECIES: MFS transporter [unclassified Gemella]MBU0279038.1 MFS transporter [Gemella sp. zg-1178]QWQ38793.1 MFS transporter [Gemella sp. zg-570]
MKNKNLLIILCIVTLVSVLRTPITGLGAIIGTIKETLEIDNTVAGFITIIPLLAFAIVSPFASEIAKKYGLEKTLFYSTIVISLMLLARFYINKNVIFLTTFIMGMAIAFGNILLPGITKKYFPTRLGLMTGFYTVIMAISASISSAVSYPLVQLNIINKNFSLGLALNIWIIISILAMILFYILSKEADIKIQSVEKFKKYKTRIYKNPKLYSLTLSMGLQSALFFCSISWFGEIMITKGFSNSKAGFLISISQFSQFPATFLIPIIADKLKNKLVIPIITALSYFIAIVGIIFVGKNLFFMIILMIFYGLAGGGAFSYVMYLFSSKTTNSEEASKVSGISQSVGYLIAAFFPPVLGYIKDISDWNNVLYVLLVISIIQLFTMIHCSKKGNIIEN